MSVCSKGRLATAVCLAMLGLALAGCSRSLITDNQASPHLRADGQASLSPTFPPAEGWDAAKLNRAREYAGEIGSAAVICIIDGRLVVEWGRTKVRYKSHSVRKSLLSALYGVAVDKGLINLQATLAELGIDDKPTGLTKAEKQAKVSDLLKARSGVYLEAASETKAMKKRRPARGSHPPGTFWYYNNWDFNVLGTIFEKQTGLSIGQAFEEWIAKPTGMQDFRARDVTYHSEPQSIHRAYPFWISTRDLARFGVLFLNQGRWQGRRVIPAAWVKESTTSYSQWDGGGYGYLWWTASRGIYYASGYGGHRVIIVPARKMVVVNRVDSGSEGIDNLAWHLNGKKVSLSQTIELIRLILAAGPKSGS